MHADPSEPEREPTRASAASAAESAAHSTAESERDSAAATDDAADAGASPGGFAALGLDDALLASLAELGYEEPTPIQRESLPPLLAGRDLLGQAGTGTGKTAAFALPLLQRLPAEPAAPHQPRALVLVPTRELAMQVAEAMHRYGKHKRVRVLPIYGGQSMSQQLRVLGRGVEVVVATPGRALDHLQRGSLVLDDVATVVLDEADEMLDMGFSEDLDAILQHAPAGRQTALFSATLPRRILEIAEQHLSEPVRISIARERTKSGEVPRVRQVAFLVQRAHKPAALGRVLDMEAPSSAIVFCRTRLEVDELCEAMSARGYTADALHGGFAQEQRDRVMKRFRAGQADLLIATDVAARGLDIDHVTHVVNYDVPTDPDSYVHRIGRTGRAGREGVAITFAQPREHRLLKYIERTTGQKIEVGRLPTVADLRHRRLELTRASLEEAALAGGLEPYHALAEELATNSDPLDVAAAAIKLYHESQHARADADEQDVPDARPEFDGRGARGGYGQRDWQRDGQRYPRDGGGSRREGAQRGGSHGGGWQGSGYSRGEGGYERAYERAAAQGGEHGADPSSAPGAERTHARPGRPWERGSDERGGASGGRGGAWDNEREHARGGGRGSRAPQWDIARLFIGLGREAGLRPGDLVGAIANEAQLDGSVIGGIQIADRFALVEVPAEAAEHVLRALRGTTIRGRRVFARRDRDDGG